MKNVDEYSDFNLTSLKAYIKTPKFRAAQTDKVLKYAADVVSAYEKQTNPTIAENAVTLLSLHAQLGEPDDNIAIVSKYIDAYNVLKNAQPQQNTVETSVENVQTNLKRFRSDAPKPSSPNPKRQSLSGDALPG
ncbi:MAG: hypothetical protein M3R00_09945, partial [Pseudomonadota bacterium]|nr:hypothetical protein [Pseudomonadota bacterium]